VGKNAKVIVGQPNGDSRTQYNLKQAHTRNDNETTQRIMVLEGRPALIATGKSIPVKEYSTIIAGGVVHDRTTTRYEDATTGFYARARLHGDRVTIEISPHMKQLRNTGKGFDIQYADTVISGQLGEWLAVGGNIDNRSTAGNGLTRHYKTRGESQNQIYLKVEELKN
ncbi:MAG: type II and III secretion system protein, partial [Chromatiales bacterium]|nr:type II and III secretion system protein [Chromatiales bacterium]